MKLVLKDIKLKEETEKVINNNPTDADINLFIEDIKNYLEKINCLLNTRMEMLSDMDLYKALKDFFDIKFDEKDYLRIVSKMLCMHYTNYINIKTYMQDEKGNGIDYYGMVTQKYAYYDNQYLIVKDLRKITSSNDFVVLEVKKNDIVSSKKEKWENHQYLNIDINSEEIKEDNELFPYALEVFRKELQIKDVLYKLRIYFKELMYQVRSITSLAFVKDNDILKEIGKKYKKAYDNATNCHYLPKKEKIIIKNKKNFHK